MKRVRSQSQLQPMRRSWVRIWSPNCSRHSQMRSDHLLAPELARVDALGVELLLDHGLRGDAGVVGPGHPQRVEAVHALVAHQHVLDRVVQRVAHVQPAGDVGRRDDDGERRRVLARGIDDLPLVS